MGRRRSGECLVFYCLIPVCYWMSNQQKQIQNSMSFVSRTNNRIMSSGIGKETHQLFDFFFLVFWILCLSSHCVWILVFTHHAKQVVKFTLVQCLMFVSQRVSISMLIWLENPSYFLSAHPQLMTESCNTGKKVDIAMSLSIFLS